MNRESLAMQEYSEPRPYYGPSRISGWKIIPLVLILGLLISRFVLFSPGYFIVAVALALVLGAVLYRNLQLGIIVLFFIAALGYGESPGIQSPHSGYRAGLMPSQVLLGFMAGIWFLRALFVDGFKLVKSELNLPLFALALIAFASLIANNVLAGTRELLFHQLIITQIAEVGLLYFSIIAFFLAANTLKDPKWIGRIFAPVVLIGLYFAGHRIFHYPVPIIWGSLILAAAVAFVYSRLLFDKLSRWQKTGYVLILMAFLCAVVLNRSWVSGLVAAAGAFLMVTWYRSKPLAIALALLMVFALFGPLGVYHEIHAESEEGGDFDRFIIWRDAFLMTMAVNPTLGVGPGNYHAYIYYHNTLWFGGTTYTTAHSNYVQIVSETGLLGLGALIWVMVGAVLLGNRAARRAPPELRWLGVAAAAAFSGIAAASVFGDYMFPSRGNNGIVNFGTTVYVWLILGAAAAAAGLSIKPREE